MGKQKVISISPAFNEETRIRGFLEKFRNSKQKLVDEILIVDDGSTDSTRKVVESYNVSVISHSKRQGLGSALKTGVKYALEKNYDIIVILAPNGKDNPYEIPIVLKPILESKADYVQGSRYLDGVRTSEHMPLIRKFATRLHPLLIKLFTGFQATDSTNGFRAIRAEIFLDPGINIWQEWLDTVSFEFYLYLMVIKQKYKIVEVPVTKIYLKSTQHFNYSKSGSMTKTRPIIDWWRILKPLFYYVTGTLK